MTITALMMDTAQFAKKDGQSKEVIMSEESTVLEFPGKETISLSDPEIQKELIRRGFAIGIPGGEFIVTHSVKLVAGGV
jgi:hypothetical protein